MGVGAWAALTWPDHQVGLAVALTLVAAGALMWWVARHRRHPWALACAALAVLLALTPMVRAAGGVVALAVLVAVVVAAAGLTLARTFSAIPASVLAWPLSALRGLPLLGRTITATSRVSVLWPALRTAGISMVALALFGGLFASGDAVFGSWAEAIIPDLGWDTLVLRTFVLVLVAGVVLTGAYLAINPPPVADLALPEGRRTTHAWEWAVPVGLVVAVVAGFLVAQAAAMWGGHEYLRRTTGLTYAEYVHQGFAQLTIATFLTLVVVALAMAVAERTSRGDRVLLRVLLGSLCLLTLAVVASALYRMALYQQAYGYTVLRVFVDGFELWLGLVVVLVLVAGIRLEAGWLARAVLGSAAVFTLVFVGMNPDAWVAQRNIERFEAGGRLDTYYLSTLSPDATPTLVEGLPAEVTRCMFGDRVPEDDGVLGWNLGRSRAQDRPGDGGGAHRPFGLRSRADQRVPTAVAGQAWTTRCKPAISEVGQRAPRPRRAGAGSRECCRHLSTAGSRRPHPPRREVPFAPVPRRDDMTITQSASPAHRPAGRRAALLLATGVIAAGTLVPTPASAVTGTVPRMWDCSVYTSKCVRTNGGIGSSDSCRWVGRYIATGTSRWVIGCEHTH